MNVLLSLIKEYFSEHFYTFIYIFSVNYDNDLIIGSPDGI